jgi:hypothetical protein
MLMTIDQLDDVAAAFETWLRLYRGRRAGCERRVAAPRGIQVWPFPKAVVADWTM